MKKLPITLSVLLLALIFFFSSCKQNDNDSRWEFAYSLEKSSFELGETIKITVTVTNGGADYTYTGSSSDLFGAATLYLTEDEEIRLRTAPFVSTTDATKRVFESGQSAQYTYEFYTDENSKAGTYTLTVPFADESATFTNTLILKSPLTEEELAVIEVANAAILKEYPISSLDNYRIDIIRNTSGEYSVIYRLLIGEYPTFEKYSVSFNTDKSVKDVYGDYGEYAVYLPYATPERIKAAEDKLKNQTEEYDRSSFYLSIDDEGYLCLQAEIIVKIPPSDHEHKFFSERICKAE